MTIHKVKSWTYLYDAAVAGLKTHDFRDMNERDYKVGDTLLLQRYDQATGEYTGEEQAFEITYMTNRETPCAMSSVALSRDHVVLSIRIMHEDEFVKNLVGRKGSLPDDLNGGIDYPENP